MSNRERKKVDNVPKSEEVKAEVHSEPVVGIVHNCTRLNIRTKPDTHSDVVCVVDKLTKLYIEEPINSWYRICMEDGTKGFCMKEFVRIDQSVSEEQHGQYTHIN